MNGTAGNKPLVTCVVVTYNGGGYVEPCLRSIAEAAGEYHVEIIAVDNASTDDSAAVAASVPGVKIIRNRENSGYAAAANAGVRAGKGKTIILLNQDTVMHPGAVNALADFLETHPRCGIAGPKMIDADGEIDPSLSRFPTVFNVVVRVLGIIKYLPGKHRFGPHRIPLSEYGKERRADWVSGGCFAFRREVFDRLGGLDERFKFYGEETDFCYNALRAGYETWYTPDAEVEHFGGTAAKKVPVWAMEQSYRSMILFFRKNYRWDRNVLLGSFFLVKFLLGFIISFAWNFTGRVDEGRERMAAYRRLTRMLMG